MRTFFYVYLIVSTVFTNYTYTQQQTDQEANTIITKLQKIDSTAHTLLSTSLQPYWIVPTVKVALGTQLTISDADVNKVWDLANAMNNAAAAITQYQPDSPVIKQVIATISKINNPFFQKLAKNINWAKDWTNKTAYSRPDEISHIFIGDPYSLYNYASKKIGPYLTYLGYDIASFMKLNPQVPYYPPAGLKLIRGVNY